uniref:Putative beta-D-xylosidase 2 n=1 Tax=Aegilops tauschii TaxID=37682 RepID=M8CAF0_AEGTA
MASSLRHCVLLASLLCAVSVAFTSVSGGGSGLGPITTNGRNYTKVCDPARFAAMGLEMGGFRYCDASLPYAERVRDLVGRLTLEEKDIDGAGPGPGADPFARPIKVSSCCKHYAAYDVDAWLTADRLTFDARVEERDMIETFERPFEMCVRDGDASCVMCSYNRINGVPACANARLLSETVRGEWQLHGYIVSDCDSVRVMVRDAKWLGYNGVEATAAAMKAGLDLDCGMAVPAYAARRGMVLIKNDHGRLPLDTNKVHSLSLVGLLQHINATDVMLGDYRGKPCRVVTPYDAIRKVVSATSAHVCDDGACGAAADVKTVDATIVIAGLNMSVEKEGNDREDLLLPWNQTNWINAVAEASPYPIILVIISAGGVDVSFAQNNPKIGAILWAGYPGEEGGTAIADVLFGKYNPGGRLPLTWYKNEYISKIPMTSMALRPVADKGYPGRTYKFYGGPEVLYPFGHGLSYSNLSYASDTTGASVTARVAAWESCKQLTRKLGTAPLACPAVNVAGHGCQEEVSFSLTVANRGSRDGTHVVLVYTVPPAEVDDAPLKQLVAFRRVFVPAGAAVQVPFTLNVCKAFAIVEETAYTVVPSGVSTVLVGDEALSFSFPVKIELAV